LGLPWEDLFAVQIKSTARGFRVVRGTDLLRSLRKLAGATKNKIQAFGLGQPCRTGTEFKTIHLFAWNQIVEGGPRFEILEGCCTHNLTKIVADFLTYRKRPNVNVKVAESEDPIFPFVFYAFDETDVVIVDWQNNWGIWISGRAGTEFLAAFWTDIWGRLEKFDLSKGKGVLKRILERLGKSPSQIEGEWATRIRDARQIAQSFYR
jgi:hypothetical protein